MLPKERMLFSTGNKEHSSSPHMDSLRASRRSKEHSHDFYLKNPRQLPNMKFTTILQPLSAFRPQVLADRSSERLRDNIGAVKKIFRANPESHITEAARAVGLSFLNLIRTT